MFAISAYGEDGQRGGVTNLSQGDLSNTYQDSGAVYIFEQDSTGEWVEKAYIKEPNPTEGRNFGLSGLQLEGQRLAIGSRFDGYVLNRGTDESEEHDGGAVLIYENQNGQWSHTNTILADNADPGDQFGVSVHLSSDLLVVGATGEDSNQDIVSDGPNFSNEDDSAGAVYVYARINNRWTLANFIKPALNRSSAQFGRYLTLDQTNLLVANPNIRTDFENQYFVEDWAMRLLESSGQMNGITYEFKLGQ